MIPLLTTFRKEIDAHPFSMEQLYGYLGITRQGYFSAYGRRRQELAMMDEILHLVHEYRLKKDNRAGSRSLYYNLGIKEKYGLGVSKFERLMSAYGMTLLPLRTRIVTTRSSLQSWNYPDLTSGLKLTNINQLVVGDLTYIQMAQYRYYLFLLTDVFSARIVGHSVSTRMRAQEAYEAFCMWMALRKRKNLEACIHHTDGGSQYFSNLYIEAMNDARLNISVASNCLANGYAEQRNGLLKYHLIPTIAMTKGTTIKTQIDKIITIHNVQRKQKALGWKSPCEFERDLINGTTPSAKTLFDRSEHLKSTTLDNGFS